MQRNEESRLPALVQSNGESPEQNSQFQYLGESICIFISTGTCLALRFFHPALSNLQSKDGAVSLSADAVLIIVACLHKTDGDDSARPWRGGLGGGDRPWYGLRARRASARLEARAATATIVWFARGLGRLRWAIVWFARESATAGLQRSVDP